MVKAFSASHRASKVCCTESISIQATDSRFSSAVNPDGGGVVDVDVDGTTNEMKCECNTLYSLTSREYDAVWISTVMRSCIGLIDDRLLDWCSDSIDGAFAPVRVIRMP
jgi:hypothetical protein